MPSYALLFADDDMGGPKRLEFEAENSEAALEVLRCEAKGRRVTLEEDDQVIAEITRVKDDLWEIR